MSWPEGARAATNTDWLRRCRDRDEEARGLFVERARAYFAALLTPELVEEHRRQPLGVHSPALEQLLAYLRQAPQHGKLAVLATAPGREWMVIRVSGEPGVPHDLSDPARFASEGAALHDVFLRRLAEAGLW